MRTRPAGDLRLLPSAAAAWCAAAISIRSDAFAVTAAGLGAAALGLVLAGAVFFVPREGIRRIADALALLLAPCAALALVLLTTGGSLARAEAGPVDDAVSTAASFTALLEITGEPSSLGPGAFGGDDRYLVDADIVGGVLHAESFVASTPVVVLGSGRWAHVGTGDLVRVLGSVEPPDRVGKAQGVFLPATEPTIREADGWLGYTDDLRSRFRQVSGEDPRDRGLLPGMALGDRIPLDAALEEDMRTTGLTHLTAVSGANCSYVLAFAFLGLRAVRCPRLPASIGAVVALSAFVLLVRPEPSVLRAAVMGAIGVVAVLSGRGRVSLTLLMLSIIALLAADPWLAVSFAFMLSVSATLGLVTVGPLVARALATLMPRVVAQLLAIPLTAQVFCTPILVLIQPSLPVYSLPANVLAAPVVPAITLLGMVAVLALVGVPPLAAPLVGAAQWGTRWVGGVAEALAGAPTASVPWPSGAPGAVLAACLSVGLLVALAHRDDPERRTVAVESWTVRIGRAVRSMRIRGTTGHDIRVVPGRGGGERASGGPRVRGRTFVDGRAGWARRHAHPSGRSHLRRSGFPGIRLPVGVIVCVAATIALVLLVLLVQRITEPPDSPWALAMCDVGQGDGIVVGTTPGHAMVVDAGPDPEAMDRCLEKLKIDVIDALIITHLHEDHYGGVLGAVSGREVRALYFSSGEDGLPTEVTEAAAEAGVEPRPLDSTMALDLPPLDLDVLWPTPEAPLGEENNASSVLHVTVPTASRPITLLLTGDLEEDAAVGLLSSAPWLAEGIDLLKIAHHGARNGGVAVMDTVDPALAVISVGAENDYGHPHPSIIDALAAGGVAAARTDELGTFTVGVVDDRLEVRTLD